MDVKTVQAVSAAKACRQRMQEARAQIPKEIGQTDVLKYLVTIAPHLNQLTLASRWHNAWLGRVADPEFTDLVERAAEHFKDKQAEISKRLRRHNMKKATN